MFLKIRKRLTVTHVLLALVLVFAMTGGAYAAKKYIITSTKQISPAVLKQLQGKTGSAGIPGAQGPAGPAGPAGTNGTNGTGKDGQNGQNGQNGNSGATGHAGPTGSTGPTGKAGTDGEIGATGPTGSQGSTGPEGVCATTHCVLPSGASEKGVWAVSGTHSTFANALLTSISFTIPLAEEPSIHEIQKDETPPAGCEGSATDPGAEPGNLCIFVNEDENIKAVGAFTHAGKIGAIVLAQVVNTAEVASANGTWAVTSK